MHVGVVVLAAGASVRLGEPKQALMFKGKSLLNHALEIATASIAQAVLVVLGANEPALKKLITDPGLNCYCNAEWQEGMGASIRNGVREFMRLAPDTAGVIIMACDQPFVSVALLNELIEKHQLTGKPIIASRYGDSIGIPAFFAKTVFADLLLLKGDAGAKKIMLNNPELLETVDYAAANIDIDTKADYDALQQDN